VESGEVAFGGFVVPGGYASPGLHPVDGPFDGVSFLVERGVVCDGPAAPAAPVSPVGGLVLLLGDDGFDAAFAQVGAVSPGGISLVARHSRRPGTGPAHRQTDPHPVQNGDELRTVCRLPRGQDQGQRAAAPVGGQMDFAGLPAAGPAQESGFQAGSASAPDASALCASGVVFTPVPVPFLRCSPFFRAASSRSSAASSRAAMTSSSRRMPAAS
jgi:hypothetical protein